MNSPGPASRPNFRRIGERTARLRFRVLRLLQLAMAVELLLTLFSGQWLNAFLIFLMELLTLMPALLRREAHVDIPPEFQLLAIVFVFAALFLGEVHGFYERFWWWDLVLHASSGLLLGLLAFLLVYVLNEHRGNRLNLSPPFVALFAVAFAMAGGMLWEIFEFAVDQAFGSHMQKPTPQDPSGLADTMWDLVVDALGALLMGGLGWWYLLRRPAFVERLIRRFIERNQQLFKHEPE